ncbi:hypothetical protein AN161_18035 [Lysinibacillus sp. FJAT-14222]|nr:hypothetical protein AN161_18035 [Lysinibacillus sp. FJAT-14222]
MGFFSNNSNTKSVNVFKYHEKVANSLNAGRKYLSEVEGETIWDKYESAEYSRRCKNEMKRNFVIWSR